MESSNRKSAYESPELVSLGSIEEQTRAGVGDTSDGAVEPPQAEFLS